VQDGEIEVLNKEGKERITKEVIKVYAE